jgi:hypothetical protein
MASTRNESTSLLAEVALNNSIHSAQHANRPNFENIPDLKQQHRNSVKTNIFASNTSAFCKKSPRKPESSNGAMLPTMLGKYLHQKGGSMSSRMKKVSICQKKGTFDL